MSFLAIVLDHSTPRWTLFTLCAIGPAVAVLIAYTLVRWRRGFAWLAVVAATFSAFLILHEFKSNLERREVARFAITHLLSERMKRPAETDPEKKIRDELQRERFETAVRYFDEQMFEGVPPLTQRVKVGVWFSVLFPFFMIVIFLVPMRQPSSSARTKK